VDVLDVLGQTPGFDNDVAEVSFTFGREHHGDASVELDEGFFSDHTVLRGECTHALNEFLMHGFGFLLARDNAGVSFGMEALDEVVKRATGGTLGKEVPGTLNYGETGVAHISLKLSVTQLDRYWWLTFMDCMNSPQEMDPSLFWSKWLWRVRSSWVVRNTPSLDRSASNSSFSRSWFPLVSKL
jgi:hypothetical protein